MIRGRINFGMLGYHVPKTYYSPRYDVREDIEFEDDRTTLFWDPYLIPDNGGNIQSEFFTSDKEGNYFIEIEGVGMKGKIAAGKTMIEIK